MTTDTDPLYVHMERIDAAAALSVASGITMDQSILIVAALENANICLVIGENQARKLRTDYRTILKRYLEEVIDDDHIVAIKAAKALRPVDRQEVARIGIEIASERARPDEMMLTAWTEMQNGQ